LNILSDNMSKIDPDKQSPENERMSINNINNNQSVAKKRINLIFEAHSIVLIGSSKIREQVGMASPELFENIAYNMNKYYKFDFQIMDIEINDLVPKVEMAIIVLPPEDSIVWAKRAMESGIQAIIQITGGFSNDQKKQYLNLAMYYHVRVLGPNTIMGIVNPELGLNTTFERDLMPKEGNISVLSQSGGVGAALLDWASFYRIGIGKFIFMGDKMDIDDINILNYLAEDPKTEVIGIYIEGLKDGRRFVELAKKITTNKPIVVLKGGVTTESAKRALSHTGSIAGSDNIFDAAFKEGGILRVGTIEELFNAALALAKQPPMQGKNVVVVSNVGGPAILAADALVREGLKLAHLTEHTIKEIKNRYPGVDILNPIDMIADARTERFKFILEQVLNDPNVDGVMVINMLKSCFFKPEDALILTEVANNSKKPIVDVPAGAEDFQLVTDILIDTPIPTYDLPDKAAKALRILYDYNNILSDQ
jgi:acyl-CoA synthetase (NDP forming)